MGALECPDDIIPFQTALNMRIGRDVIRVVIIDKIIFGDRQKYRERCQCQQQREESRGAQFLLPKRLSRGFLCFIHRRQSGTATGNQKRSEGETKKDSSQFLMHAEERLTNDE